jgi:WD40 repeat protein
VRVWDAVTDQPIGQPLSGHTDPVSSIALSPDGTRIASGSYDNTVRVWDAVTGQPIGQPLSGHTDPASSVAFSPDGTRIASGSYDNTVRVWDAVPGRSVVDPLSGYTDAVTSVAVSLDGNTIVSGSYDNTLRLWPAYPDPFDAMHCAPSSPPTWAARSGTSGCRPTSSTQKSVPDCRSRPMLTSNSPPTTSMRPARAPAHRWRQPPQLLLRTRTSFGGLVAGSFRARRH